MDLRPANRPSRRNHCAGPNFPLVLANVLSVKDRKPLFKPYVAGSFAKVTTFDGKTADAPDQVGVIAFTPPKILDWDKRWLNGVVYTGMASRSWPSKYIPR